MIIATKDNEFHKVNSLTRATSIIRHDQHPGTMNWMVEDAMKKHRKLFGWRLIEKEVVKNED